MKKSLFAILTAFVLTFTSIAFSMAEESTAVDKVFSFLEKIRSEIAEQKDTGEEDSEGKNNEESILNKLKGFLDSIPEESKDKLDQAAMQVLGKLVGDAGLEDMIGGLFAMEDNTEDSETMDFDYTAWRDASDAYAAELFNQILEPGDEQILFTFGFTKEDGLYAETEILGFYGLANYIADGADLKMKNYAGNMLLMTIEKNEDGTYTVTGAEQTEDGEGYAASFAALCGKYGVSVETVQASLESKDWLDTLSLIAFMDGHPQYERIEYQGELKTLEEINKISDDLMFSVFGGLNEAEGE